MSHFGIGDLAQNVLTKQRSSTLQANLLRLTDELSSGRVKNLGAALKGDFGTLGLLERQLTLHDGYAEARASMDLKFTGAQTAYDALLSKTNGLGASLLSAIGLQQPGLLEQQVQMVSGGFDEVVRTLNTRIGDQYIFSGVEVGTPPLLDSEVILANLRLATAGASDARQFIQTIDDWFLDSSGGFATSAYQGGAEQTVPLKVGEAKVVKDTATAAALPFKQTLKEFAKIALIAEGAFASQMQDRNMVMTSAATGLLAAHDGLVLNAADLGNQQARVDLAATQATATKTVLNEARAKLREADPFETATKLQAVQQQLESLYLVTSRNARLSLAEYLR